MGMTVKELITRLLEEPMNEEACLQTSDARFMEPQNKEGKCIFHITDVEHWGGAPFINFEDWRPGRFIKNDNELGMSIDEAIEITSDIDKAYRSFSNMEYKAMQKSMDVMRKYQKIEKYFKDNNIPQFVERGTCSKAEKDIWEILDGKID